MSEQTEHRYVGQFRKPEYTGENRCTPCTIVNLVIAGVASLLVGLYTVPLGVGVLAGSVLAIYLRGYLVPYTPTLTKRYFPDRVLRLFDKEPTHDWETEAEGLVDIEDALRELGLVEPCEGQDDLCLDPAFERAWQREISSHNGQADRIGAVSSLLGVEDDQVSMDQYGSAVVVRFENQQVGQWESDAALVADVAANSVLSDTAPEWKALDPVNRGRVLNSLRMFLESCPSCGGSAQLRQETVESCCREMEVAAVACESCGARLFEVELDGIGRN